MPKTLAIPAVSILLTAILALILLHRPESVVGVSATPPMPENTTTTQLSEEHLWIEIPRKAHEPQLQIEIQPDKLILPEQDNQALSEQALDRQKKKLSYRFATRMELGKKASEIGSWNRRDGMATWRLLLESPNATSLNLGLDQFHMPPGGKFVFSGNKGRDTYVFTSADNEDHGELWTPIVRGSTAKLEITLPEQLLPQMRFRIETVNHGFRDLIKVDENGVKIGGDTSGSCNVDVACSEGDLTFGDLIDFYRNQIGSVGAYTMGGTDTCSGALINNTSNDQRALFLTANHCGIDTGNAASMVVYWNFQNSTCRPPGSSSSGGVGNGDLTVFNTGSVFRAAYSTSDFCLVELDDPVNPANDTAFFAGWDRSGIAPADMVIGIHHPAVAEKRISFDYDPTTRTTYLSSAADSTTGTHIRVIDWNEGTTEGGSSGSPLFNSAGQIVGQLHGGYAACGNDLSDWYGRVSRSWTGGGNSASRLSDWLDPTADGANSINGIGLDEYITIADASISEGNSGVQVVSLIISLSEATTETVTCEVSITGGDAVAESDFVNPGTQQITFNPGVTSGSYDITINGDTDPEENESIIVSLSNSTNATISDANATMLILNDDFIQPVVTGPNRDTGTQSTSYSAQITANHTPTSYSLSGAPAGMTVDSLSGEISWPSPVIGNYSITLRASNSADTGNGTLNLTITPSDIVTAFEIPSNVSSAQSGSYNWAFQTSETIDGVDALVVSAMGGDSEAHLDLTINGPDQLLFFRKVSTEEDYDFFEVSLDGTMIESISGVDDWAPVSIDIPAGEHVVRISYTKDGGVDGNQDSVWIDHMTLASSSPPAFNIRNNIAVPSGVLVSLSPNPVFNVTSVSPVLLPPGVQFTDDDHLLGTFTSQQTVTLRATNAFGSNTRQFTITPYTVDANVGNAVGASTLSFSPGNSNAWFTQTGITRSGGSAIRSGVISDDQSSTLTTSVYGPGTLNFHWRCSTESDYDFGEVLLNGSIKESVSGEVTSWQPVTLNLEAGLNEIIWRYRKDDSESDGDDAVYVDDINLGGFAGWVASAGLSPYAAPPGSGTDGDENSALMEYAIGGSVTLAEALFQLTMNGDPGSVSISIPANDAATDISMKLQKSTNLQVGSWTDLTPRSTSPTLEAIDEQAHDRVFYRLHVEVP